LQVILKDRHPVLVAHHPMTRDFDPAWSSPPAGTAGVISRALEFEKLWKYGMK
jgi:hypothetical protein